MRTERLIDTDECGACGATRPATEVSPAQRLLRSGIFLIALAFPLHHAASAEPAPGKWPFDTVIARTKPDATLPKGAAPAAPAPAPAEAPPAAAAEAPAHGGPAVIRSASVDAGEGGATRFRLGLSKGVRAEIFTLANPYRVIIDLPDVAFELSEGTGRRAKGLISAFRFGLFAARKGRVVIDATGPVRIEGARMVTSGKGRSVDLVIDLKAVSAAEFGAGTGAGTRAAAGTETKPAIFDDEPRPKSAGDRPLVMIDPGHGGIDPGALGANSILEKTVVLAVAQKLRRRLEATGRYRVTMTRSSDVFISLDQRVQMSRETGADLFISLHADSIASKTYAATVRGATVYTLSEKASDEQARQMAEKENASDLLAGIDSAAIEAGSDEVRSILIDLMKRETANFATDFSNLLVGELRSTVSMSKDPQRSAAFRVLRQTHAPSVLVELGYMSNDADARLMRQTEWQGRVAQSIVEAVNAFFDRRTAGSAR